MKQKDIEIYLTKITVNLKKEKVCLGKKETFINVKSGFI